MPDGELGAVAVPHGQPALFGPVGRVTTAVGLRPWQEHRGRVVPPAGTNQGQFDLEEPCGRGSHRWPGLRVEEEEGDEPVALVAPCPPPEHDLRLVGADPDRAEKPVDERERNGSRERDPRPHQPGSVAGGNPIVAGPRRADGQGAHRPVDPAGQPERGRRETRHVRRDGLAGFGRVVGYLDIGDDVLLGRIKYRSARGKPAQQVPVHRVLVEFLLVASERPEQVGEDKLVQLVADPRRVRRSQDRRIPQFGHEKETTTRSEAFRPGPCRDGCQWSNQWFRKRVGPFRSRRTLPVCGGCFGGRSWWPPGRGAAALDNLSSDRPSSTGSPSSLTRSAGPPLQ